MKTAAATARRKQETKQQARAAKPRRRRTFDAERFGYAAVALLLVAVAGCYANSLWDGFVFDDHALVLGNPWLRTLGNLPQLLVASYRPLRDMSHALEFALWGENPFGFHLTNVLIHTSNVVLVFWLIRRFTGSVLTSTLAALVFAVHPLQTDAVTYISGRRDVLFALFYLASFHCYLSYCEHRRERRPRSLAYFALFLLLWGLSLMSKEMAVSLPLFVFVWSFCESWDPESSPWWRQTARAIVTALKKDRWLYILLAVASLAYGWYMTFIKGGSTLAGATGFIYWGGSFYTNLLTVICVHAWYLKQLVFPTPVVQYLGAFEVATTILSWRVILSIIVVAAVLAAGLARLNRDKLTAFAALSYFVLLLPVSQIIPHHELLADHYLYLPMMSFGLAAAILVSRLAAKSRVYSKVAYAAAGVALAAFATLTILRNRDWKDDFTLWQANYKEAPTSIRAAGNLAGLQTTRNPNKAIELYRRCIELDPTYAAAYMGLATLLQTRDDAQKLEPLIQKALDQPEPRISTPAQQYYRSSRWELMTALAMTKYNQGELDEATQLLWQVISNYPTAEEPYKVLAGMYHENEPEKELEVWKRQVENTPLDLQALNNVSRWLILEKRYDEALPYLERVVSVDPNNFNGNCHLGQIYQTRNDCPAARTYFLKAGSAAITPEQNRVIHDLNAGLDRQCGRQ